MANTVANNLPTDRRSAIRPNDEKRTTHKTWQEMNYTDLTTTAVHLNAYIKTVSGADILKNRTHVEISVTHATAKVYIKRFATGALDASSSVYTYVISNTSGFVPYVKIPMDADTDLSIIADGASTTGIITELA